MIEPVVISSRIRLARNFHDLPFPNKLSDLESATSVSKAIFAILGDDFEFRRLKHMDSNSCLRLLENHTISKELIDNKDISGYAMSPDGQVTVMINEEDHLRLQCIINEFDLKKCYIKLSEIDDKILGKIDMAYSKELGFLTACPTNVVMKQLVETLSQNGLVVRGLFGEDSACEGYFYQISNRYTLGLTEEEIIDLVTKNVSKIIEMELSSRKTLKQVNKNVIIDMCYRAYGLLTNSYMMPLDEAIMQLSKLRFGVVLGLVKLKNPKIIDDLYTLIQPAHLEDYYSLDLNALEQSIFRAKFLSENLENKLIKGV